MTHPDRPVWMCLAVVFAAMAPTAVAENVSIPGKLGRLAETVRPPARFADHTPEFHIVEKDITYHWWDDGALVEQRRTIAVVMDGEYPVAMLHPTGRFFGSYPGLDTRDWFDERFNPNFPRFGTAIPNDALGRGDSTEVVQTGRELTWVVRRGPGADDAEAHEAWLRRGVLPDGADEDNDRGLATRYTLRVDPVFGYVVDRHSRWRRTEHPTDRQGNRVATHNPGAWYAQGITSIWPEEISYAYSGVAWGRATESVNSARRNWSRPDDPEAKPFVIWSNNSESMYRRFHPVVAAQGFAANLRDRRGWGVALTHEHDQASRYNVCPIWGGYHTHMPINATQAEDGGWVGEVHQRLLTLPPEIVDHIIDNARQVNDHGQVILIRVEEDFEDQPLPAGTTERGFQPQVGNVSPVRISAEHAYSGRRSLEADGVDAERFINHRFFPRDRAHTRFLPGERYRLECKVKVEGEDTEAFIIPTPAMGLVAQRLLDGEGVGTHRTESVRAADGWRKVHVEFTGQPHGNPMNVQFVVIGEGKGYFDAFRIYRLPAEAGQETAAARSAADRDRR